VPSPDFAEDADYLNSRASTSPIVDRDLGQGCITPDLSKDFPNIAGETNGGRHLVCRVLLACLSCRSTDEAAHPNLLQVAVNAVVFGWFD
jgi:hypothetical protein